MHAHWEQADCLALGIAAWSVVWGHARVDVWWKGSIAWPPDVLLAALSKTAMWLLAAFWRTAHPIGLTLDCTPLGPQKFIRQVFRRCDEGFFR